MEETLENISEDKTTDKCNTWYTLMVMSNFENKVLTLLQKQLEYEKGASDFFHEVLMPSKVVTEVKRGKKSSRVQKLYPGYLFVRMDMYNEDGDLRADAFHFAKGINGVRGYVGGNKPTKLKSREIEQIQEHIRQFRDKETPKNEMIVGQKVRILDGPFINFEGPVTEANNQTGLLKVNVSIFGRDTPVELESWQVEKSEKDS
jgi:transcriptional antiterminator NusG